MVECFPAPMGPAFSVEYKMQQSTNPPSLLLIRHGETQWNKEGRLQGQQDTPLSLTGIRQCQAVADNVKGILQSFEQHHYWMSPLARTQQTASICAAVWGVPFRRFQRDPALMERHYGKWEGHTLSEVAEHMTAEYLAFQTDRWHYASPGGESLAQVYQRAQQWLTVLPSDGLHIVVSHSGCLAALHSLYCQTDKQQTANLEIVQTSSILLHQGRAQVLELSPTLLANYQLQDGGRQVRL